MSGVENKKGPHAIKVHDFKLTACNICTLTNERFSRVYSILFFSSDIRERGERESVCECIICCNKQSTDVRDKRERRRRKFQRY